MPTLTNSEHKLLKYFKIICSKFIIDDLEGIKLVPKVVFVMKEGEFAAISLREHLFEHHFSHHQNE